VVSDLGAAVRVGGAIRVSEREYRRLTYESEAARRVRPLSPPAR
jgi:hypothetical protein